MPSYNNAFYKPILSSLTMVIIRRECLEIEFIDIEYHMYGTLQKLFRTIEKLKVVQWRLNLYLAI